jgi:hypothetical protein
MTPDQQRKFNTTFGGVFIGAGILAWMLAVYFAVKPNDPAPAPVVGLTTIDVKSCRTAWAQLGYLTTATNTDVSAYEALSDNPKEQLERASTAILACKLPLRSFCMGQGCERPGLSFMVRKPLDLKIDAPTAAEAPVGAASVSAAPKK